MTSITIPFSNGIVAAFVFVVFELLFLPLIIFATTKFAALSVQRHAEQGKKIKVRGLVFPLWNEGLLNNFRLHWIILLIRVLFIIIPVYLESRLIASEKNTFRSETLPASFRVAPVTNWVQYANATGEGIYTLRDNSVSIFDRCTSIDDNNWLRARVANATFRVNGFLDAFSCVNGTEDMVYKIIDSLPNHVIASEIAGIPPEHENIFNVSVDISYGPFDLFAESPETNLLNSESREGIFKVDNVKVMNDSNLQCFSFNQLQGLTELNVSRVPVTIMCQNVTAQNTVEYYSVTSSSNLFFVGPIRYNFSDENQDPTERAIQKASASTVIALYFVGQLQFMEEVVISAENIVNTDFLFSLPFSNSEFNSLIRRVLYVQQNNITVDVLQNETVSQTTFDIIFIIIAAVEVFLIIVFAIGSFVIARINLRLRDVPTTLNGLSKSCMQDEIGQLYQDGTDGAYMTLRLNSGRDVERKGDDDA